MIFRFPNLNGHLRGWLPLILLVGTAMSGGPVGWSQDDATARFASKLSEWKNAIIELTILRQEFFYAENRELALEFRQKYDDTKARGDEIVRELKMAAADAYRENPNRETEYYRLLTQSLKYDLEDAENQTVAFAMAQGLNSHPIQDAEIASLVGKCYFMNNQFEEAEKLLQFAAASDDSLQQLLELIPRLEAQWVKEQKARARDQEADLPRAVFETTQGNFVVELFEDDAPNTVRNFVSLARKGFYDNQDFFRVVPFMFAATGSTNAAAGSTGYLIPNEALDPDKRRGNFRGTLAAPAVGEDKIQAAGTIFVITFAPYHVANTSDYCNFGRVIEGMEAVDALARSQTKEGEEVENFKPDKIIKVTLENLRENTEYEPEIIKP